MDSHQQKYEGFTKAFVPGRGQTDAAALNKADQGTCIRNLVIADEASTYLQS